MKWTSRNMTVLIPMSGAGSRFEKAGYSFIKPMIPLPNMNGKPMIQVVVENLGIAADYVFIVQKEHYKRYSLNVFLELISPRCKIVQVDGVTEGAACSALLAKEYINNSKNLLIANSDQFIEWTPNEFYYYTANTKADGLILTFESTHPKWSYAKVDPSTKLVTEVAEKNPISNNATVGIYWYKKGSDFVKYAEQMIANNVRHGESFNGKGEFYIAPVYNEAIKDGKEVMTYNITKMHGIGDPESFDYFVRNYKE